MFSVSENIVREKVTLSHSDRKRLNGKDSALKDLSVQTLTDDSSLFLMHRYRSSKPIPAAGWFRRFFR